MSSEQLFGLGLGIVIALLAIVFLRRPGKEITSRTPKSILDEVEVLMAYGRKKTAVGLLRKSVLKFPDSTELSEKLVELE